jgi:hypothetical protein
MKLNEIKSYKVITCPLNSLNRILMDEEMYARFKSVIPAQTVKNMLLFHDLQNLTEGSYSTIEEFKDFVIASFSRFPASMKETSLEDDEWVLHTPSQTKRYPMRNNEIIFENSLKAVHKGDRGTLTYLDAMQGWFSRHIAEGSSLSVKLRFVPGTDNIFWIVFLISY